MRTDAVPSAPFPILLQTIRDAAAAQVPSRLHRRIP
jgi:hypothetical protein